MCAVFALGIALAACGRINYERGPLADADVNGDGTSDGGAPIDAPHDALDAPPIDAGSDAPPAGPCAAWDGSSLHSALGSGTTSDPYVICSAAQLRSLAQTSSDHALSYLLGRDIDVGEELLFPIGGVLPATGPLPFRGLFDGGAHTIRGLRIDATATPAGLFGRIDGATIRDLVLEGAEVQGASMVGALAGSARNATIDGVTTTARVSGTTYVGGLLGDVDGGTISDAGVGLTTSITCETHGGGLLGRGVNVTITDSVVVAPTGVDVHCSGDYAGGLAGELRFATVRSARAGVDVVGAHYAGGLVGLSVSGSIDRSTASGDVGSSAPLSCGYVGGLVGRSTTAITECAASGDIDAAGGGAGGLVGWHDSATISDSFATGDVQAGTTGTVECSTTDESYAGGLLGYMTGRLYRSYATGAVSGQSVIGGLVGHPWVNTSMYECFAVGRLTSVGWKGGLYGAGHSSSADFGSYWSTDTGGPVMCGRGPGAMCNDARGVDRTLEPAYFMASTLPPLMTWDFVDVWEESASAFPMLRRARF